MLKDGLYEQVISEEMDKTLQALTDKVYLSADIDQAESAKILADYVAEVLEKGFDNLRDHGGDTDGQIELANKILALITEQTLEPDFLKKKVASCARQLLALQTKQNSAAAISGKADIIRPETSIAQSSLFYRLP